jgi:hypothetical protein
VQLDVHSLVGGHSGNWLDFKDVQEVQLDHSHKIQFLVEPLQLSKAQIRPKIEGLTHP